MPRDTLNREQVVNAAIDLLDSEGLEGLNMRALGKRLGSAATAVYWHVGSKDNLIALAGLVSSMLMFQKFGLCVASSAASWMYSALFARLSTSRRFSRTISIPQP